MWQSFTKLARDVVIAAKEYALIRNQEIVSTEHLLLGLFLSNESRAARVISQLGFQKGDLKEKLIALLPPERDPDDDLELVLSPSAKQAIDLAYIEARRFDHNYIGTEHLLLGLIRQGKDLAGRFLAEEGISLAPTRLALLQVINAEPPEAGPLPEPETTRSEPYAWAKYELDAQRIIAQAGEKDRARDQLELTADQILVSILEVPDSGAMKALRGAGIEPQAFRADLDRFHAWPEGGPSMRATPQTRKAIEAAFREATRLRSKRLGTEHLLLGLFQADPDLCRIFSEMGLSISEITETVEQGNRS